MYNALKDFAAILSVQPFIRNRGAAGPRLVISYRSYVRLAGIILLRIVMQYYQCDTYIGHGYHDTLCEIV